MADRRHTFNFGSFANEVNLRPTAHAGVALHHDGDLHPLRDRPESISEERIPLFPSWSGQQAPPEDSLVAVHPRHSNPELRFLTGESVTCW